MKNNIFQKTSDNFVKFYLEGDLYYEHYLKLIQEAQKSIHLQTYIFEEDRFGVAVINELKQAAQRGVKVYILIDSVGSLQFSDKTADELLRIGIYFCRFNNVQFKWLGQWGRRLHHKVLLVDQQRAFIGGINVVSTSYGEKSVSHHLDFAVYIEGPATLGLTRYCQLIFSKASQKKIKFDKDTTVRKSYLNGVALKISINDWIYRRWQITKQYSELTQSAKKSIIIVNSYFFPRRKFMKQLAAAAKRGIRVRLIFPKISDWPSYVLATQYLYGYFLKNGVEIYQWKKTIMHGKLAIIDEVWSTIGSFNLNYTSYQQNLEMNVDIYSKYFSKTLNDKIENIIDTDCEKIVATDFFEKSSVKIKFLRFLFYILLQMVANLSIGLAFQEEENRSRFYKVLYVILSLVFFIVGIIGSFHPTFSGGIYFIIGLILLGGQVLFNNKNV